MGFSVTLTDLCSFESQTQTDALLLLALSLSLCSLSLSDLSLIYGIVTLHEVNQEYMNYAVMMFSSDN